MDTDVLLHLRGRRSGRRQRIVEYAWMLAVALVVLAACLAFGLRMAHDPGGRPTSERHTSTSALAGLPDRS